MPPLPPAPTTSRGHGARFLSAAVMLLVLLPAGAEGRADRRKCRAQDEYVPVPHGDGGGLWIPREVACGGSAPLLVMLHGSNTDRVSRVSLGGGRALGRLARRLIDARRARPVILAEPVHFRSCGSGLYDDDFGFDEYRIKVEALLAVRRIRVQSYSVVGHSGAGCCGGVHRAAEAFGPVRLVGLVDVCYGAESYARAVLERYAGTRTIVFSVSRGASVYAGYPRFERRVLGRATAEVECDGARYRSCRRSAAQSIFAFSTARRDRRYHGEIPTDAYRSILARFFRPPRTTPKRPTPPLRLVAESPATQPERSERGRSAGAPQ